MTPTPATRAVLVGWSSADWRIVSPLLDEGGMPNLSALVERGVCGNLASLWPDLPPLSWTSIATGKRPHRHGILGFAEPDGVGGVRPITRHGRTATPLWSIASRAGLESVVVNFGPTWPADHIAGACVSNRFVATLPEVIRDPRAGSCSGLVHPEMKTADLAAACATAMRVPEEILRRFLPGLGSPFVHAAAVSIVAAAVAAALATAAIVRDLAAVTSWSLLAVRFSLVDQLADRFLMFHPPPGPGIDGAAFAAYCGVIAAAHRLLDDLLGELVAAAGPEACIAVASDRGLQWTRLRAVDGPSGGRPRAAACGLLALAGPGIKRDERVYGSTILDICPTVLRILGLSRGADMDGRVLDDAFTVGADAGAAATIPSWEEPPAAAPAAAEAPAAGASDAVRRVARERALTLARCLVSAGDPAAAEPVLRRLVADQPADAETVAELAECLRCLGRPGDAVAVLEGLDARTLAADAAAVDVFHAGALVEAGRPVDALERLRTTLERHGRRPEALVAVAQAEAALAHHAEAEAACREALVLDATHHPALVILASALYRLERYSEAAEAARNAVALRHFDPSTHLLMGTALAACGRATEAITALETATRQAPGLVEAHERLAIVHARQRRDFAAADSSRRAAREAAATPRPAAASAASHASRIVVVSGLPRSGTSLMMQMLAAGGIPPLTDRTREADEDNPHGYLEFDAVRRLARDASWIAAARGRAVKVVCPLVPSLPLGHDYRVVLMVRDMHEVLASQRAMLGRRGADPAAADERLQPAFERQLDQARAWCVAAGTPLLEVGHRDCIREPAAVAARVEGFVGGPLDIAAMTAAVDASLWRNRS